MAENNQLEVEGFLFNDEKAAEKAQKEAEAARYIKSKTDRSNPDMVLALYHKVLEQDMFETPVGYTFLADMQEYLKTIPYIQADDIYPIPVSENYADKPKENVVKKQDIRPARKVKTKTVTKVQKVRTPASKASIILNAILLVIIVVMFAITFTSDNVNIINYETKIQNKYASWEEDLKQREADLNQREKAVSERE